ncbi:NAD(P)/FAD-dependent oxidoreductase, partial [Phenylobacterium sp.]|uniref:NAD(P)/FAD-dependent oxidoreductase n=1 Tax=Phenylobacterium sp. TaxID=1871053 RepID=UPI0037851340
MTARVVIAGTGQAGVQTAFSLRDDGYDGEIVLLGEEPGLPYQRPPLSKSYLLGKLDETGVLLKGANLYGENRITLRDGVSVQAIDRPGRSVRLSSGEDLSYDHLVLATGARQRALGVPGEALDGVLTLRTIVDARGLKARLEGVRRAVVVGAGFIGLEFAAVARAQGVEVTVVELAPRPLSRALSAEMSLFFHERHLAWGVDFIFGALLEEIRGEGGRVTGVRLQNGVDVPADLVLVGVGVIPNAELAADAGLLVENGVVVDAHMRTTDPAILAVGDCAAHPNPFSAVGPVRVESVQNATDQGRCAAATIVGTPQPYAAVPWFWSDQADLKLQMAGLSTGHDTAVVRGDPAKGAFSVFCFKDGRLLAVESVNKGPDHVMARRLIAAQVQNAQPQITAEQAAD